MVAMLMRKRKPNFILKNTSNKNAALKSTPTSSKKTQKNHTTCLGWIDRSENRHHLLLRPFDKDLDIHILLKRSELKNHDVKMHTIVRVALRRLKGQTFEGKIVETFPSIDDPELERAIVVEKHALPTEFSDRANEDAERARELRAGKRIDLTHATIVTIDGETAKDFDDAIGVEKTAEGHFLLTVSIADVSHFVREGTALNDEAYLRATSVYLPNFVYPMLPERLSNDLCSLVPQQERLTLTCEMLIDTNGQVIKSRIYPSKIKSQARLTYTLVAEILKTRDETLTAPKIAKMLFHAEELAQIVRRNRTDRGSLDLDLPEPELIIEKNGDVSGVRYSERNEAHRLIEDFMILANEQVSEAIEKKGYPSIYRVHEIPDPLKMDRLKQVVRHWGFTLSDKKDLVGSLQSYLDSVRGHKNEKILVTSLLRSLKQAQYSANNVGHFGLGSESYTHFTSPIRRFPDLMIHRILRKSDFLKSSDVPYAADRLEEISRVCSERERRAFLAERDLEDIKKTRFMADKVGRSFSAVVVSVKSFGLFVELEDYPVEGLIPLRLLPRDEYFVDELETCLKGYKGKNRYWLGDTMKVQLIEADRMRSRITFKPISRID